MTGVLWTRVRRLERLGQADGDRCPHCPAARLVYQDSPWGTAAAPASCPRCGRVPRLVALEYRTDFYDHAQVSGEATP
jgi:hypothetical protein